MGRLTRWGVDHRGFKIVPARLGRGYVRRFDRRQAMQRVAQACAVPEPAAELEPDQDDALLEIEAQADVEQERIDRPPFLETYEQDVAGDELELEEEGEPLTEALRQARAPLDVDRFIAAMRAKPRAVPAPPARQLEPAHSREECPRCGVPGFRGCAHQLPFVPVDPASLKALGC